MFLLMGVLCQCHGRRCHRGHTNSTFSTIHHSFWNCFLLSPWSTYYLIPSSTALIFFFVVPHFIFLSVGVIEESNKPYRLCCMYFNSVQKVVHLKRFLTFLFFFFNSVWILHFFAMNFCVELKKNVQPQRWKTSVWYLFNLLNISKMLQTL